MFYCARSRAAGPIEKSELSSLHALLPLILPAPHPPSPYGLRRTRHRPQKPPGAAYFGTRPGLIDAMVASNGPLRAMRSVTS
jgi:hypothetical protein